MISGNAILNLIMYKMMWSYILIVEETVRFCRICVVLDGWSSCCWWALYMGSSYPIALRSSNINGCKFAKVAPINFYAFILIDEPIRSHAVT